MNDDTLADLKQFIAATIYQQTSDIKGEITTLHDEVAGIKGSLTQMDQKLSKKIDDLSDSVAEAMSSNNDVVDAKLEDHKARITQLENSPA